MIDEANVKVMSIIKIDLYSNLKIVQVNLFRAADAMVKNNTIKCTFFHNNVFF